MIELIKAYEAEKKKWKDAGKPMRTSEQIAKIHAICSVCPDFEKKKGWVPGFDKCGICQCNLHKSATKLNKIAWATTECPKDDPEWTSEIDEKASDSSADEAK